ncbi:MAG: heat-inducible transcriptional repressor HrcA [Cycloclasticus sp.]|nr:heat-inducible transcriptional repressor HrcA [Cycloclasticus sp.]MBQ0790765.1 heat-inducible transcriptional repressor HrcA [Cycloclasticus sp.]
MHRVNQELNERSRQLLKLLVERYITDGQPVGSAALSRDKSLGVSPATIRHVMADLENLGLIHSPHTSAGRIPTNKGYRFFVDSLLTVQQPEQKLLKQLKINVGQQQGRSQVIASASQLLSGITHLAGVVSLPKREAASFRQIEFMPLSKSRVLVILVTNDGEVHNKVIQTTREFTSAELQCATNYLNSLFGGQSLRQVKTIIAQEMSETRQQMNQMMIDAINLAHQGVSDDLQLDDLVLSGATNLMDFQELSDISNIRHLFDAFSQKQDIIQLLDRCMQAEGVQIFIGDESGYQVFGDCSLVTAPYTVDNETVGVLGVIGPTRMAYDRVIPMVDITAKFLGEALKS